MKFKIGDILIPKYGHCIFLVLNLVSDYNGIYKCLCLYSGYDDEIGEIFEPSFSYTDKNYEKI